MTFTVGGVPEEGTAVAGIMKPVSCFALGNPYCEKCGRGLGLLTAFYNRFKSLVPRYPISVEYDSGAGREDVGR